MDDYLKYMTRVSWVIWAVARHEKNEKNKIKNENKNKNKK